MSYMQFAGQCNNGYYCIGCTSHWIPTSRILILITENLQKGL